MIKKRNFKGFTIAEAIIACSIFAFISMILFACFNNGHRYLAESSSRLENERGINLATQDLNLSIRNTSLASIKIASGSQSTSDKDVLYYILMSSASTYDSATGNILNNDLNFNILEASSQLNWNFKIAYFTAKISHCPKCVDMGLSSSICPHKYLVKRYFAINDEIDKDNPNPNLLKWSEETSINDLFKSYEGDNKKKYDKILARNVIVFIPALNENNEIVYTLKLLKGHNLVRTSIEESDLETTIKASELDIEKNMGLKLADSQTTVTGNNNTTVNDKLSKFTTQINYTVKPINK